MYVEYIYICIYIDDASASSNSESSWFIDLISVIHSKPKYHLNCKISSFQ